MAKNITPGWMTPANVAAMRAPEGSGDVVSMRTGETRPRGVIMLKGTEDPSDPRPENAHVLRTLGAYRIHAEAPHVNGSGDTVAVASREGDTGFVVIYADGAALACGPGLPRTWDRAMDRLMWASVRGYVPRYS